MRLVTQAVMVELFAVIDDYPLSREAITVPLEMAGEGGVRLDARGKVEITLPGGDDLAPFLAGLPARLRALGVPPDPTLG